MATFTASVPLNIAWRDLPTRIVVEVVSVKSAGIPWPANTPFPVPDVVADRFEDVHGPKTTVHRFPTYSGLAITPAGEVFIPPGTWTRETVVLATIPGLTRL